MFARQTSCFTFHFQILLDDLEHEELKRLVSARNEEGTTPMLMACQFGRLNIVKYLKVECGADLEQTGSGIISAILE